MEDNMNSVKRVYVEKKQEFAVQAKELKQELKSYLGIQTVENVRVLSPQKGALLKLVTFVPEVYAELVRTTLFNAGAGTVGAYDSCSFNLAGKGTFRAGEGTNPVCGEVGELPEEEDELVFLQRIKDLFQVGCVKHSAFTGKPIREVALCGGSGAFLIKDAIAYGADVFITGEAKYNDFYDVEDRILLAVIGHYESEVCTKDIFYNIISKKFPTFAVHFSNVNSNPVKYL